MAVRSLCCEILAHETDACRPGPPFCPDRGSARETPKPAAKPYLVPYRLTCEAHPHPRQDQRQRAVQLHSRHGAAALFVVPAVCEKFGIKAKPRAGVASIPSRSRAASPLKNGRAHREAVPAGRHERPGPGRRRAARHDRLPGFGAISNRVRLHQTEDVLAAALGSSLRNRCVSALRQSAGHGCFGERLEAPRRITRQASRTRR